MHLRMIVSALFLFTTACTAPASDPSSQNPGDTGDEVGEVNHASLPGGDVDGQRDAVPMDGLEIDLSNPGDAEEEPFEVIMPQEPEQPANPDLPECLEIPGAAGCAGEPVAPNLEDWECPDGWRALEVSETTGHSHCAATSIGLP
jgi:hypothetical protein